MSAFRFSELPLQGAYPWCDIYIEGDSPRVPEAKLHLAHYTPRSSKKTPTVCEQALTIARPKSDATIGYLGEDDPDVIVAIAALSCRADGARFDTNIVRAVGEYDRCGPRFEYELHRPENQTQYRLEFYQGESSLGAAVSAIIHIVEDPDATFEKKLEVVRDILQLRKAGWWINQQAQQRLQQIAQAQQSSQLVELIPNEFILAIGVHPYTQVVAHAKAPLIIWARPGSDEWQLTRRIAVMRWDCFSPLRYDLLRKDISQRVEIDWRYEGPNCLVSPRRRNSLVGLRWLTQYVLLNRPSDSRYPINDVISRISESDWRELDRISGLEIKHTP